MFTARVPFSVAPETVEIQMPRTFPPFVASLVLVLVTLAAYLPAFQGGFILDDDVLLTANDQIRSSTGLSDIWFSTKSVDYWPATNTTLWLEWRLWGPTHPAGYHTTNIFLHIVESLLLWLILRKLKVPGSYLAALLFAVHPVNVESVAWIASRKNLVAMLFMELSVLCCLRFELPGQVPQSMGRNALWYGLSLVCFILAMLGKGSAVSFPFILLLTIYWLRPLRRSDFLRIIPYLAVAVALGAVNVWFQTHGKEVVVRDLNWAERLISAGYAVWFYLYKAFLPINLAFVYPDWNSVSVANPLNWAPLALVFALTAALWFCKRSLFIAWAFFLIAVAPALGLIDVGYLRYSPVADRYQHLGLISVAVVIAAAVAYLLKKIPVTAYCSAFFFVAACVFLTFSRTTFFESPETFYRNIIALNSQCWMAHNNLGMALANQGKFEDAIVEYDESLGLRPVYPEAFNNKGIALEKTGKTEQAINYYEKALQLRPDHTDSWANLGLLLYKLGRYDESAHAYEQALKYAPRFPAALNNVANAYIRLGRIREAVASFQAALEIDPKNQEANVGLGLALVQNGLIPEAIAHLEKYLKTAPNDAGGWNNLGMAFFQSGNAERGIDCFRKATEVAADFPDARSNYGIALVQKGDFAAALVQFQKAVELRPTSAESHFYLATAYEKLGRHAEAVKACETAEKLAKSQNDYNLLTRIESWKSALSGQESEKKSAPNAKPVIESL